jgi:hypothetical protein
VVTTLPDITTSITSSHIDSMYQNMNCECVIRTTLEEITKAAAIAGADSFLVSLGNTSHENKTDQCSWYDSVSCLDATDNSICSMKEGCNNGNIYFLQNMINVLAFFIKKSYIVLENSTHLQRRRIPHGGHSSGHVANRDLPQL